MRPLTVSLLIVVSVAGILAQQPQVVQVGQPLPGTQAAATATVKGTGLVLGQIVDARGDGVPSAIVTLLGGLRPIALTTDNREIPGGPRSTITTRNGQFAFFDLTPGTYTFEANKPGYLAGAYGRLRPGGLAQSINLKDGERLVSIRIPIWEYASVAGTIRDESGEAVVGVQVRALRRTMVFGRWQWTAGAAATTNDRGDYRIDMLTPGQYVIVVSSTQTSVPATVPTAPGAQTSDALIALIRAGLANSNIVSGRPIGDWMWNAGTRTAMTVPNPTEDGLVSVYPTTFFPSARSTRSAEAITVESGQQRTSVDLQLQLVPTTTVSGTLMGVEGPLAGQAMRLVPDYADDLGGDLRGLEPAVTVTNAEGRFFFAGVPLGQYFVQAEVPENVATAPNTPPPPTPSRGRWLNDPMTVTEGGIAGITLTLHPAVRLSGRMFFDGSKPPPPPELIEQFVVSLETLGFAVNRIEAPYQATVDRNGQFVLPAVPPGQYVLTFRAAIPVRRAMPDWETRGATLDGKDITDRPFTLSSDVTGVLMTLTDHNSELNGTVRAATGQTDPTAAILLFTTERDLWPLRMNRRIRALRASETGAYSVRGVPPGEYFLVAVPDVDVGNFPDPSMLDALTRTATRFVMGPGERKTQDLVVRPIK